MLLIRGATSLDLFSLLQLGEEFYNESSSASKFGLDIEFLSKNLQHAIDDENFCVLVAIKDSEIVGALVGVVAREMWAKESCGYINMIFVQRKHRNLVTGLKLVAQFEKWCSHSAAYQIGTHSGIGGNFPADALFRAAGYHLLGKNMIKFKEE